MVQIEISRIIIFITYNPPLYKSSGGLLDVARITILLFRKLSNKFFKIKASQISVT